MVKENNYCTKVTCKVIQCIKEKNSFHTSLSFLIFTLQLKILYFLIKININFIKNNNNNIFDY